MRPISILALTIGILSAATPGQAAPILLGQAVTGTLTFNGGGPNYFDPANGFVPVGCFNKTQGTTVTIAEPGTEFCFADSANQDSANFTDTALTIADISRAGAAPFQMTFVSSAFLGRSFTELSDTFAGGGLTLTQAGNMLTLNFAGSSTGGSWAATYEVAAPAAVPEPASMLLLGTGLVGVGVRRWKQRKA